MPNTYGDQSLASVEPARRKGSNSPLTQSAHKLIFFKLGQVLRSLIIVATWEQPSFYSRHCFQIPKSSAGLPGRIKKEKKDSGLPLINHAYAIASAPSKSWLFSQDNWRDFGPRCILVTMVGSGEYNLGSD